MAPRWRAFFVLYQSCDSLLHCAMEIDDKTALSPLSGMVGGGAGENGGEAELTPRSAATSHCGGRYSATGEKQTTPR